MDSAVVSVLRMQQGQQDPLLPLVSESRILPQRIPAFLGATFSRGGTTSITTIVVVPTGDLVRYKGPHATAFLKTTGSQHAAKHVAQTVI